MESGMQVKYHNFISIESKKQSKDSPEPESTLTSTNVKTWHCTTSKLLESLTQPFEIGKIGQQVRRHGKILKLSSQQSTQRKTNNNKLTAKNFKANMIEEQAKDMEELITALAEKHTQQMEALIKSTMDAMKEMMSLIKNEKKESKGQTSKEKRRSERKGTRNTMMHQPVNTVERNTLPKQRMIVGK
jgi:hypothetical protein